MRKCALSAAVMLMAFATTVSAKDIDVGALPDSVFADTEVSTTNGSGECFPDVGVGSWLFSRDWNLMKVTRRGVEAPSEWCRVTNVHSRFSVFVR